MIPAKIHLNPELAQQAGIAAGRLRWSSVPLGGVYFQSPDAAVRAAPRTGGQADPITAAFQKIIYDSQRLPNRRASWFWICDPTSNAPPLCHRPPSDVEATRESFDEKVRGVAPDISTVDLRQIHTVIARDLAVPLRIGMATVMSVLRSAIGRPIQTTDVNVPNIYKVRKSTRGFELGLLRVWELHVGERESFIGRVFAEVTFHLMDSSWQVDWACESDLMSRMGWSAATCFPVPQVNLRSSVAPVFETSEADDRLAVAFVVEAVEGATERNSWLNNEGTSLHTRRISFQQEMRGQVGRGQAGNLGAPPLQVDDDERVFVERVTPHLASREGVVQITNLVGSELYDILMGRVAEAMMNRDDEGRYGLRPSEDPVDYVVVTGEQLGLVSRIAVRMTFVRFRIEPSGERTTVETILVSANYHHGLGIVRGTIAFSESVRDDGD